MITKLTKKFWKGLKTSVTMWVGTIGSTLAGLYLTLVTVAEPYAEQLKAYLPNFVGVKTVAALAAVYTLSVIVSRMRSIKV